MQFLIGSIKKDKQMESLVEKLCNRFSGVTNTRQWEYISYCLSQLTFTEKGVKKLMELFKTYEHVLSEDSVMENFRNIVNKAKKFAKPEMKSCIEEFEEKLVKFHIEKKEQELTAQNAQTHQQKLSSLENFIVAKNGEESAESDIVEDETDADVSDPSVEGMDQSSHDVSKSKVELDEHSQASSELRCTYRAYNDVDEITAAYCIGFNPAGTKIFAGYNKSLRIFDIHRPGRDSVHHSTVKGNNQQPGIISSIAFSPSHTGLLATGSYGQTTAIYREDNMELLYILHGQQGGVTHVQFSKDGNYLYTGGRKDPYIICWDIRKAVDIVFKLYRSSENTNQRILFDIDPFGQHLGTGGEDGLVHIYNLQTGQWVSSFQAALDTVNCFSFHPFLPMAGSSSGHRRFVSLDDSPEDFSLCGDENCASIWSFAYASMADNATSMDSGDSNLCQDP